MTDRTRQIEELEAELRTRGASFHVGNDFDEEMRESFLRRVLAFEDEPKTMIRAHFAASGYEAPEDLWTLIARLAELNIVIERTDHLDDAALCEFLLAYLDEPLHLLNDPETIMHIDLVGSGSDEDNALFFRYYASDEEREYWMQEFPGETLPPRKAADPVRGLFAPALPAGDG